MHHAVLYNSLPSLHNYDVKCPNFKFFWGRERKGDKVYHLCLNSGAAALFCSNLNPLFLSNRTTSENREMVWKDEESIFQWPFHGRRRCRIVRSLLCPENATSDSPVPSGIIAEAGILHFSSWRTSSKHDKTHPTVPSPPHIKTRKSGMDLKA